MSEPEPEAPTTVIDVPRDMSRMVLLCLLGFFPFAPQPETGWVLLLVISVINLAIPIVQRRDPRLSKVLFYNDHFIVARWSGEDTTLLYSDVGSVSLENRRVAFLTDDATIRLDASGLSDPDRAALVVRLQEHIHGRAPEAGAL